MIGKTIDIKAKVELPLRVSVFLNDNMEIDWRINDDLSDIPRTLYEDICEAVSDESKTCKALNELENILDRIFMELEVIMNDPATGKVFNHLCQG